MLSKVSYLSFTHLVLSMKGSAPTTKLSGEGLISSVPYSFMRGNHMKLSFCCISPKTSSKCVKSYNIDIRDDNGMGTVLKYSPRFIPNKMDLEEA